MSFRQNAKKAAQAVLGLGGVFLFLWEFPAFRKFLAWATTFDFFYERIKDPSWVGEVINAMIYPPPGTALLVALVGLVLIYWGTKPRETRMSPPIIGMLICVIGFAGFGIWYLVRNQAPAAPNSPATTETAPSLPKKLALDDFERRRTLLNAFFDLAEGKIRDTASSAWGLYNDQPRQINTNQKDVFQALVQVRAALISASTDMNLLIRRSERYPDIRNLNWNFHDPLLGVLNELISRLDVPVRNGTVVFVDSKETDQLRVGIDTLREWVEKTREVLQAKKLEDDASEIIGASTAHANGASFLILEPPPESEGHPLGWQKSPYLGWQKQTDGSIQARTIAIRGKNIGKEEVQLTDAYIVSGITGRRLNLNIFGRNPDGTGSMTAPKDTYPIPPDANMQLSTDELNGTAGVQESDFLKEWSTIYFTAEYNGEKHRITYDRKTMEALFAKEKPKPPEPHVARRQQ